MGWSPIRRIKDTVKDVAKVVVNGVEVVADDFLGIDDSGGIVGSVSKIGEKVEDGLREAVDEVDKAIQNPYVQLAISIATGGAATPYLSAYATLDSGENLSATQIAALAATAGQDFGAFDAASIDPEVVDNIKKGVQVATSDDPVDALITQFGGDVVSELGLDTVAQQEFTNAFGEDVYNIIKDNEDLVRTGWEIGVEGKDASTVIANRYGQDIVDYLGAGDAVGYAGLKTAVALDQGLNADDALLAGAEEYYKRDGELPDLGTVASVGGVNLPDIDFGDTGFIKNLYSGTVGKIPGLPDAPDLAFIEDYIREYSPNIKGKIDYKGLDLNFGDIARSDIDLNKIDFGVDVGDFNIGDLPNIGVPDVTVADFTMPEFTAPDFTMPEFTAPTMPEIGDYDIPDLPSLDLPFGEPEVAQRRGGSIPILRGTDTPEEETDEQLKIDELLLADFSLRNPLLRG